MSPRRKQSTKELGAILNEAVPLVVAEEVQLPVDSPDISPEEKEVADDSQQPRLEEQPVPDTTTVATADEVGEPHPQQANDETAMGGSAQEPLGDSQHSLLTEQPVPDFEIIATVDEVDELYPEKTDESPADEPVQESQEPVVEPVLWRKSTIPFREDQYQEIGHVLAEFHFRNDVQMTIAEVVRLGLDKMIAALIDEELQEQVLVELYQQQRRESQGNENLKHSKSRGLGEYLATHGISTT